MRDKKRSDSTDTLPPFFVGGGNAENLNRLKSLKKSGKIRKIGPRLYTSLSESGPGLEAAVRKNWASLVSSLFPDALLSHRSALEYAPAERGEIFLTSTTNRRIRLPGLTLVFKRGPGSLAGDLDFLGMKASSAPRAFLEVLDSKKGEGGSLSPREIETRLESILEKQGEKGLNALRDAARKIAPRIGRRTEFSRLDGMIGALLGTRGTEHLSSRPALARARGKPYDSSVLARLEALFTELRRTSLRERKETFRGKNHFRNKAFFEAYFSNYIEGTTFEIEEAERIVFDKKIPERRPKDAHDVLGTFALVSDPNEMRAVPVDPPSLLSILKRRHSVLMEYRPEAAPGRFKDRSNRAGDTEFVSPEKVEGTLAEGLRFREDLPEGLPRAIFMMFFVSEVHPFIDGNGRIARIMMNAELYAKGMSTIIIPTVFREDYLLALRALSRRDRTEPLVKALDRAQEFSSLDFSDYRRVLRELEAKNWYREPGEAKWVR